MNNRENRNFKSAREVSLLSEFHGPHIGAIVEYGKSIISTGYNSTKTRPLQHQYNIYRDFDDYQNSTAMEHAETAALSHLIGKDIEWDRVSIYLYRELKNGKRRCCRPCSACMQLIKDLGIKNIYYIDENGDYCKEKVLSDKG
jgi:deoxycytidylate deaminase